MVTVSAAFRAAMADPTTHPQRMVFQFDNGTIISNEDIDVEGGVDFNEVFFSETDLTIGLTPSSEISFGLFNDDDHYTNFTFGAFNAYIGVRLSVTANGSAAAQRPAIAISNRTMTVSGNGRSETYELCPLGRFIAARPAVVQKVLIDVEANDQMTLFDEDMPSDTDLGIIYPITAGQLLQKLCTYVGVQAVTYTFINSTLSLSARPESFDGSTMREVVGWIAEAAGANARFNREGLLEMAWFNTLSQTYSEGNYTEFEPSWYPVPAIDKLHIRNADSTAESVIGTGTTGYMIQNNPFLRQDDTEVVS